MPDGYTDADRGDGLLLLLELDADNALTDKLLLVDKGVPDRGSALDPGDALLLLRELDTDDKKKDELAELTGLADIHCGGGLLLLLELDATEGQAPARGRGVWMRQYLTGVQHLTLAARCCCYVTLMLLTRRRTRLMCLRMLTSVMG